MFNITLPPAEIFQIFNFWWRKKHIKHIHQQKKKKKMKSAKNLTENSKTDEIFY